MQHGESAKPLRLEWQSSGAHIAFSFLSSGEKAKALENKLHSFGVKAKGYKSNAGSYDDCEKFVNEVIAEHGTVDVCINNAGISKDSLLMRLNPDTVGRGNGNQPEECFQYD